MSDLIEIDRMTIPEYELRLKAFKLKQVDTSHEIHQLAWAIAMAQGRKKNGRPVYRKFSQFFNFKKAESAARGESTQTNLEKMKSFIANFNSWRGG